MDLEVIKQAIIAKFVELFHSQGPHLDPFAEAIAYGIVTATSSGSGSGMRIHGTAWHQSPVAPHGYLTNVNPYDHHVHLDPVIKSDWSGGETVWALGYNLKVVGPVEYMVPGTTTFIPLDPSVDYTYASGSITFNFEPGAGAKTKLCSPIQ